MGQVIVGRALVRGRAEGPLLVTRQPLSFWGGLDARTGFIIDPHHDLSGRCVTRAILALPRGRGSSTASAVLLDSICRGTAPAAILTSEADLIVTLAAVIGDEAFGLVLPMVLLSPESFAWLPDTGWTTVEPDGRVTIEAE
jgi:hypothetical protein